MEPLLGLVGMFSGLMLWSFTTKVLIGIVATARNVSLGNFFGELTPQKIRTFLAFLFAASCIWALAFAALASHFIRSSSAGIGWAWFFGGMATAPVLVWATTLRALRKIRQRAAQGAQP